MKKLFVLFLMIGASVNAQSLKTSVVENTRGRIPFLESDPKNPLTGMLSQDLFAAQPQALSHRDSLHLQETRSSLAAGVFSLIIPGAGQVYNGGTGNYLKAAGFLALEAAAIAVNIAWNNKGNNQTTFFQNYANGHYSALRYAQWIALNYKRWDPTISQTLINEMLAEVQKNNFEKLNAVETDLGTTSDGQFFTHNLPAYGQQQYYELIGKYPQFREGWNLNAGADTVNVTYDQLKYNVEVEQDNYYMGQRGLANHYYSVAGTALGVVIANHFLSAIEAAIWAHGHNKEIETTVGVSPLPVGLGYQTQLNVVVHF
jgi:hypothetical protein